MSFIMFTTRLAIFLTVMYHIHEKEHITAESVFLVTSYYQIMRTTMTVYFPQGVAMVRRRKHFEIFYLFLLTFRYQKP